MNLAGMISNATGAVGAISGAVGTASRIGNAISSGMASGDILSALRASDLPAAGEAIGDLSSAFASFGGDANEDDWRVRLSLPNWPAFRKSPVLGPLKDAGGLIFPYTPQITIASSATYNKVDTVHTNYQFQAFKNMEIIDKELKSVIGIVKEEKEAQSQIDDLGS